MQFISTRHNNYGRDRTHAGETVKQQVRVALGLLLLVIFPPLPSADPLALQTANRAVQSCPAQNFAAFPPVLRLFFTPQSC